MARRAIVLSMVAVGFTLQAVAYFRLAARIGVPTSPAFSNPRLPYAALVFIAGVVLVFLAIVVYELLPEKTRDRSLDL